MGMRTFWVSLASFLLLLGAGVYALPMLRPGVLVTPQPPAVLEEMSPEDWGASEMRRGPCLPGPQVAGDGEGVSTGPDERASLCLGDFSRIYFAGETTLQAGGSWEWLPQAHLVEGKVWADIRSGALTVTTEVGSATGSLMSVYYSPETGRLEVACAAGPCRLSGQGGEVTLEALEQSALTGAEEPEPAEPISTDEILDWFAHVPGFGPGASAMQATPTATTSARAAAASATRQRQPTATRTASPTPTLAPTETLAPTQAPSQTASPRPTSTPAVVRATVAWRTLPPATLTDTPLPPPTSTEILPTPTATEWPTPEAILLPTNGPTPTGGPASATATLSAATPAATPTSTLAPTSGSPDAMAFSAEVIGAGPIPGPSPTWSVYAFPTPYPASGPTKLGFHVTLNGGGVLDYVAAVHPPVMKGVDDIGVLKDIKAISPETITIGRYVVQQLNIGEGDPAKRAVEFVNEWLPKYRQHAAYVDYWEGWNEVTYPNYEWYAVFEATRACEMKKHGLKAAIGAFSTGTPEPWQFEAFLPAIEAGIRCGAILTTHEYGAPTMYLWWSQGLPPSYGHPAVPAYPDRGPLMGRYRYLYRDILVPRGLTIPLVISEAGIDGGAGAGQRPGYGGQGWLGFRDYWANELGIADPEEFYVEQLAWYDSLLRQDPYVIGATIFNISGGSSWESFEASSVIPQLIDYAQDLE